MKKPTKKTQRKPKKYELPEHVHILKTCTADMGAWGGFKYPSSGMVEALDWDPNPQIECGNGLHGLLYGQGGHGYLSNQPDAKWLVLKVARAEMVKSSSGDKVRFRRGEVVYCGDRIGAYRHLNKELLALTLDAAKYAEGQFASKNGGHAASTGDYGHAASTGDYGHAASTGYGGHAASTGNGGHAASTGNGGHAASTGYGGHAAVLGTNGKAMAGENGTLSLAWYDEAAKRSRVSVAHVGESGIKPLTWYRLDRRGQFVEAVDDCSRCAKVLTAQGGR